MRTHYHFVESTADLFRLLLVIASEARRNRRSPLLHFETHGSEDGLQLASGEELTWEDLRPALTDINDASHLNLVVFVAACLGLDLTGLIQMTDRAPVRMVIGPHRVIYQHEIEVATNAFYSTLLTSGDVRVAYDAMNDAIEVPSAERRRTFYAFSAEQIFRAVMRLYFQQFRDEEDFAARIEKVVNEIIATRWAERALGTSHFERRVLLGEVRDYLMNHHAHFDESWRRFFFVDRYPENADRFAITFEDCWNYAQASPAAQANQNGFTSRD